jgi:hypothetical protein
MKAFDEYVQTKPLLLRPANNRRQFKRPANLVNSAPAASMSGSSAFGLKFLRRA